MEDNIILININGVEMICLYSHYEKLIKQYPQLAIQIKVMNVDFYDDYDKFKNDILLETNENIIKNSCGINV